jgi:CBS domain-containing protein
MNVKELMQTEVVSVEPGTSLKDVARILVERGISGVPVRDADGRVIGVVSETDILFKEQGRAERESGLLRWLMGEALPDDADELAKVRARTAGEAMTSPAITIRRTRPAAAAARLMIAKGVNRLPVVDADGRLVGIVTRADLVKAFTRPDTEIVAEIREDILQRVIWAGPERVQIAVQDGDVDLSGELDTPTDVEVLGKLVEKVPGVVSVRSTVTYRIGDPERADRFAAFR